MPKNTLAYSTEEIIDLVRNDAIRRGYAVTKASIENVPLNPYESGLHGPCVRCIVETDNIDDLAKP